jgi:hypothetical protein
MHVFEKKSAPGAAPKATPQAVVFPNPVPVTAPEPANAKPALSLALPEEARVKVGPPSILERAANLIARVHFQAAKTIGAFGVVATTMARTAATACRPAMTNPYLLGVGLLLLAVAAIIIVSKLFATG